MKKFGVDISRWQGEFDFERAVLEGIQFVIVKGGGGDDGLYTDSQFNRNYNEAKAKGLPVGCYWFSKATTEAEAIAEADYFYNNIVKGKQFELPVYMDVEHNAMLRLGRLTLTNVIKAFCNRMESYKCWVGIYSSLSIFKTYMNDSELERYAHWVAQWANECTYDNKNILGVWQFGGETNTLRTNKVAGVTCDQNYMFIDYPTLMKQAGLNGYTRQTTPTTKPVEFKIGDKVKLSKEATIYGKKAKFAEFVYNSILYIREINGDRVVISTLASGDVTGAVNIRYLERI